MLSCSPAVSSELGEKSAQIKDFFTGRSVSMDYGPIFWPEAMTKVKIIIIVMFISAVWTHSDGTHSLQRIHQ